MDRFLCLAPFLCVLTACGSDLWRRATPDKPATVAPPPVVCDDPVNQSLALTTRDPSDLSSSFWLDPVAHQAREAGLSVRASNWVATGTTEHALVRYELDGVPVCGLYARADRIDGVEYVHQADLPAGLAELPRGGVWSSTGDTAAAMASSYLLEGPAQLISAEACWWQTDTALVPAWQIEARAADQTIAGFANGESVYRVAPVGFSATGSARVFADNRLGSLVDVELMDMDGSGFLRSKRFHTTTPSGYEPAFNTTLRFAFSPEDGRFDETSAFVNAERMVEWMLKPEHDYDFGCQRIDIRVHEVFRNGNVNNADYVPAGDSPVGRPLLRIGDGDGTGLRNLPTDRDVVSHELGHHVVYRGVRDVTDYESLVIHEAMADFFLFARTQDPCLGESICPAGSPVCEREGMCLRSADNTMKLTDGNLPQEIHKRSQFLSGMMWDLAKELGFATITPIAFRSIKYMLPRSSYRELVVGLLMADSEVNQGKNACRIHAVAVARGLASRLATVDCQSYVRASDPATLRP